MLYPEMEINVQMSNILHLFCPSAVDNKEVFSVQSINGNGLPMYMY